MRKFRLLIIAMICAISAGLSSCNIIDDALTNSITNRWVTSEEFTDYTIYYIYEFNYDDTYTYEELRVNDRGGESTDYYAYGLYEFSNFYEELTLYPSYPYSESNYVYIYDALILNGILQIKELYTDGYYYWSYYYKY